ncbi:tyrosine-type recombinase/integrase [Pandoraea anhela]|uniref:tyrosine-type recombinase/integrase n=1 Tax=Pandoraea anhela TaxID=2508295 RepID=UPI001242505F|nr:tyrosine-type recombinase/integrase [Pandoraea anhela]
MYEQGRVRTNDISGIPLPTWPDGRWCIELAAYLDKLKTLGRSMLDRGGTLGTYISELTPLIRYCFANKVNLHHLTDAHFVMFMRNLAAEKKSDGEQVRNNRTIVRIGRRSLAFLHFVGLRRRIEDYLAPDGLHIRAVRRTFVRGLSGNRAVRIEYWHHSCFPAMSEVNHRYPITENNINLLRKAAVTSSGSSARRMRRLCILRLLEATGARRIEVANLKVSDVRAAKGMERPFLKMMTVKRRGKPEIRFVPISHAELDYILEYIENYRAPTIERLLGGAEHDIVFINHRTGKPIVANTVTLELYILRRAAGIKGKAHPHLFRHRFFTVKIYRLIRAHHVRDAQHFIELFMRLEQFKVDVMEQTGIKSVETLNHYVDWAFALGPLLDQEPAPAVDIGRLAREGRAAIAELEAERDALTAMEYAYKVERELKRFVDDLSRAEGFRRESAPGNAMLGKALGVPEK